MKLETQQNWFHEFWSNIELDVNFGSLNQFKSKLKLGNGF
jgi:hypothetical protein